jgi:hypothetical protein
MGEGSSGKERRKEGVKRTKKAGEERTKKARKERTIGSWIGKERKINVK